MKLNYKNLKVKSSLIKSATGLSLKEFDYLTPPFQKNWERYISRYTFKGKKRERARTIRTNSTFKCTEDMLIFILYDYRHNPTQEFMGLHFELTLIVYLNPVNTFSGSNISCMLTGLESDSSVLFVLYDIFGNKCFSKAIISKSNGNAIFVIASSEPLAPGIYLITASYNDKLLSRKIIIE